jgi:predicted phage terminase large subunit-like protein
VSTSKGRDAKTGDYSAFVLLQVMADGTLYVDANLEKRNTSIIVEMAVELSRTFKPDGFAVETNQFQELLVSNLNRLSRERGMIIPVCPFDNQVPKIVRIRRLTPLLTQGRIRFKAGSRGARLLVEQLRDFPTADFDDGPDSCEMAVRLANHLLSTLHGLGPDFPVQARTQYNRGPISAIHVPIENGITVHINAGRALWCPSRPLPRRRSQ